MRNGSNTKVGIYLDAIKSSKTCQKILKHAPTPNAITQLEAIDRDDTCLLSLAGDAIKLLMDGILKQPGVEKLVGEVLEAYFEEKVCHFGVDYR